MNKYVVIAAGGIGSRMQSNIPKQFLLLHNKTIIYHSVNAFVKAFNSIQIIISAPKEYIQQTKEIFENKFFYKNMSFVVGGNTRFNSVKNAIDTIESNSGVVFIHDAARCLVTEKLIKQCYETTLQFNNAIPIITATDSVRIFNENKYEIVNRNDVKLVQTPQTFLLTYLQKAYSQEYKEKFTDDASVVEEIGIKLHFIDGEITNLKITTQHDLTIANAMFL